MITIALVILATLVVYMYGTSKHKYWKCKGVKHDRTIFYFGNNVRNYLMQKSVTFLINEMYWKYPTEKVVGYYRALRPELIIRDPEIARQILFTDFAHFYSRGLITREHSVEPLLKNLFFVDGDTWRLLRQRMTPAFTSGKLKAMFPLIVERAERLQRRALAASADGAVLDARDLMARYTTDFIGACGFGLDSDSLTDENSAFRRLSAKIFQGGPMVYFIIILKELFPGIFKHFKTLSRVEKDMFHLVSEIQKQRNYEPSRRNDFIDLLLECKKMGSIVGESIENIQENGKPETVTLEFDEELLVAQVFLFLAAGFETSSTATSITLHELAYNPAEQDKVQEEIDRVLTKHNNKLSYESIKEMTYLEWTLKEGMRILPAVGFLQRECTRKYTFDKLDLTIDRGVRVIIPLQAMHNDPKYFDSPSEFRPGRFDPDSFDANNKHVYMPFGGGPRACTGERLGLMQSVAGLAAVLSRFRVMPSPATRRRPALSPYTRLVQTVQGGLPLLFLERKPPHL